MQEDKNSVFQLRFPQKLLYLINLRTDTILWGSTGKTILLNFRNLHHYLRCADSIFKTTIISSFVRQLNLYGFRKVTSHLQDPLCNANNPNMHEYVHNYFQYGRPNLLSKITRKGVTSKKYVKPKNHVEQLLYLTPLEKARQALRIALKKAAQSTQNLPERFFFECEVSRDNYREGKENTKYVWLIPKNRSAEKEHETAIAEASQNGTIIPENMATYKHTSQDTLMDFNGEACQQSHDNFPVEFLSMPDLDPEPQGVNSGVQLLAEFINDNEGITNKIGDAQKVEHNSLNCVLPSISNQIDDASMAENKNENSDQYHGDWDQMYNDIMINRGPNQECDSDMKELYSQISKTIDLLNS